MSQATARRAKHGTFQQTDPALRSSQKNMATVRWVCVVVLFLSVFQWQLNASQLASEDNDRPLVTSQFTRYRTFRPLVYHGREKRHIQDSSDPKGHVGELSVAYTLNNRSYILDLRLQRDLITDSYFEKIHLNGKPIALKSSEESRLKSLCHYQGNIRNLPDSWVALSTCAGLSGIIFDGTELHYVEPKNGSSLADEHFFMSHSDLSVNLTCGTHSAQPHSSHHHHHHHHRGKRHSNNSQTSSIRGPFKANSRSRYVELVLVIDNKCYENQDKDLKRVLRRSKDIANIVNALYAPLNIFVALVGVVVWTEKDEIQISVKGDETLTNFLHYRRVRLTRDHPNDNAQLLTGVQFQGGVVGKALKGPMCTYEFSGGVSMDHSPAVGLVATTVAHEMGHNFGMEHDNDSLCECPDDRCIMAASSSTISPTRWSSCSLENLALAFEHGMDYCLRNKPVSLADAPECGNMFLEEGEECDCGLPENCKNPCCNPYTCKLHTNASCATGDCCDISTCSLKTPGSLCRSALQECDLPEYCTGSSEFCPNDLYKMNGVSCGKGKAYCYDGSCRSHSDQCRLLWGPSGQGSDAQCYKQNTHGNKTGNCGYLKFNDTYVKCASEHVHCGLLHCSHLNERLEFGMESVAVLSHSFFSVDGKIVPCRTANVDLGVQDVDPGLVPNGAKCGDNRMCLNQTCVSVTSVLKSGCPHKCSYNGECNNLGKCHCKIGFAPPHCDYPGPGGSEDGGPASDPNLKNTFVVAMYVIFLGIVPFCTVIFCCWYCYRDRQGRKWFWESICGSKKHMSALPTRGSPDFTQAPQSTPSNSPSRRVPGRRRFSFWPFSVWMKTSPGKPVPADDFRRDPPSRLEISQPIPLRPNGNSHPTNQSTSTTFAQSLAGHFKGFTLSPLNEHPDSSFDSFDSAESSQGPARAHKSSQSSVSSKEAPRPVQTGMVAARANFFANAPSKDPPVVSNKSSTLPLRPAPAIPLPNPPEVQKKPTVTHTEITITKTIAPVTKEATKSPESSPLPKKIRPLSVNVAGMKAMFNKSEPNTPQSAEPGLNSTLQKMASIFKPNVPSNTEVNINSGDAPPSGGSSLPRNQSIKAAKINRESLRGIEISNPIPQSAIELTTQAKPLHVRPAPPPPSDTTDGRAPELPVKPGISSTLPRLPKQNKVHFAVEEVVETDAEHEKPAVTVDKSESMRIKGVTPRPNIPHFGSMRGKRPVSMPFARPTSPPPNPPPSSLATGSNIENEYSYDDCSAVRNETDAIYASIDDLRMADPNLRRDNTGSTTTTNSDGLLSEIVSELKKKNLDSITPLKNDGKTLSTDYSREKSKSDILTGASTKPGDAPSKAGLPTKPSSTANNITSESSSDKPALSKQPYKPYSSSLAARNRYLGNSGGNAGATSSQAVETADGNSAAKTTGGLDSRPLPQQPPVGKPATSPVSKHPPSTGVNQPGANSIDVYSTVNKGDSKKSAGTSVVKPKITTANAGLNNKNNVTVKGKAGTPATSANNKPAAARPSVASAANKPANRPAATSSSNSSLARPNATPSSGKASTSSLVQNMQKKFDATGPKAGPVPGVKSKTNAKQ